MKYQINIIEQLRMAEKKERRQRSILTISLMISFALLILSGAFTAQNIIKMQGTLERERMELERIETEYRKYKTTRMIVDKADIEQLDQLQSNRIYWTKKLAAMAFHLPNQLPHPYWITAFSYKNNRLNVKGYGFISPQQEQLITLDEYLKDLRADSTFADVFGTCYLNTTSREDEGNRERITYDYTAEKTGASRR